MRGTFSINSNGGLVSKLSSAKHELSAGMAVEFATPFDTEFGAIPAGAKGWVESVREDDGTVWIKMEGSYPALFFWDNLLAMVPFDCEDLVTCIRLPVDKRGPRVTSTQRLELVACLYLLFRSFSLVEQFS